MAAYYVEALLPAPAEPLPGVFADFRWNNTMPVGTAVSLTFSFMTSVPSYSSDATTDFVPFTPAQKAAARAILGLYQEISNITFVDQGDGNNTAKILFGMNATIDAAGYAYNPDLFDAPAGGQGGDVWLANIGSNLQVAPGDPGYSTILHEVGHALGLKHPFDDGSLEPPYLPGAEDSAQYTVMSYTGHPHEIFRIVTETSPDNYTYEYPYISPTAPMLYDIAAIQYLYGANMTTRAGNTPYTFDPDTPFFKTLWDGGGIDVINVANFTEGCEIDLRAGHFSSITILPDPLPDGVSGGTTPTYDGTDNLAIAFGAIIENATGGAGADRLTGNGAGNTLTGNGGNDTLLGGAGNDTYIVGQTGDVVTELYGQGIDTLQSAISRVLPNHVERLTLSGTGNTNGTGNALANILTGNTGGNLLNGGAGADTVKGMGGNDTLVWSAIDRLFDGGVGVADRLKLAAGNLDLTAVANNRILNIEQVQMTGGGNNTLTVGQLDVLAISSTTDTLRVFGDAGDTVIAAGFTDIGLSGMFHQYQRGAFANLLVDTDVTVVI